MEESINCPNDRQGLSGAPAGPSRPKRTMLCSLRVVPVCSEHFLGRRFVMELSTTGRARELRVFRSLEQLMCAVEELGLRAEVLNDLHRQLIEEGSCQLLDIVL